MAAAVELSRAQQEVLHRALSWSKNQSEHETASLAKAVAEYRIARNETREKEHPFYIARRMAKAHGEGATVHEIAESEGVTDSYASHLMKTYDMMTPRIKASFDELEAIRAQLE